MSATKWERVELAAIVLNHAIGQMLLEDLGSDDKAALMVVWEKDVSSIQGLAADMKEEAR